jgi:hypothetical protein
MDDDAGSSSLYVTGPILLRILKGPKNLKEGVTPQVFNYRH